MNGSAIICILSVCCGYEVICFAGALFIKMEKMCEIKIIIWTGEQASLSDIIYVYIV